MEENRIIQNRLLDLFKYTIDFLDRHNLKYIACGGTVLGAVRHKGFIPWDDDIDIYMWREDYNRLLQLKEELKRDKYDLLTLYTDLGYSQPFAKIIDRGTTIWAQKEIPFLMGLFIDIFPLDRFANKEDLLNAQRKSGYLYYIYNGALSGQNFIGTLKTMIECFKHKEFRSGCYSVWRNMFLKSRVPELLNKWIEYEKTYVGGKGDWCCCVTQWEGKIFKSDWFVDTILMPFEDIFVVVPKDYDSYLTVLYDNWHRLPPPQDRINHESHCYYFNLREGLTLDEVKKRIINGETLVL